MPQRIITGPVLDAVGSPIQGGEVTITPLIPAGRAADGLVVTSRCYPIENGALHAPVIVPGMYRIEIVNELGKRVRFFGANIPDGSLDSIELDAVYADRLAPIDLPPSPLKRGDALLSLTPRGGRNESVLAQVNGSIAWVQPLASGDMKRETYDPTGRRKNLYNRANHTGTQPVESVTGLADAFGAYVATGYSLYAMVCDRRPEGTNGGDFLSGAERLRALNHILVNNSGLAADEILIAATSGVTLAPGRRYFGWVVAPSSYVSTNYLRLKSTDGSIDILGHLANTQNNVGHNKWIRLDFRCTVPADGSAKVVQVFHRCEESMTDIGMGVAYKNGLGMDEEYTKITILSRPV